MSESENKFPKTEFQEALNRFSEQQTFDMLFKIMADAKSEESRQAIAISILRMKARVDNGTLEL